MHILGFALLFVFSGLCIGFGVGFWIGMSYGREQEAKKWKPEEEWKKKEVVHIE